MENSRQPTSRRGMAIFAVLSLMVVFTVLGVAAITMAQRDNAASGNVFDIKQREAAAYAGLVYAQNELARDPANFVALLESWRTKTVYGGSSAPYPPLYLKFDAASKVQLTKTKPTAFTIPGTTSSILVEVVGITLPSTSTEEPRIALRSTGSGSSGDEQTLLGVYQIKNIRVTSASATMPITHPLYISGGGDWNNDLQVDGGNAFLGGKTHLNSAVKDITITNGGLRVANDFEWDAIRNFNVAGDIYINGNLKVNSISGVANLQGNMVVANSITYSASQTNPLSIGRSLYVLGSPGIPNLNGNFLEVGRLNPNSVLYIPRGVLTSLFPNAWVRVKGSAFLHQIEDNTQHWALDVSRRLELAEDNSVRQSFTGAGNWGQLVVRNVAATSKIVEGATAVTVGGGRPAANANQINIVGSPALPAAPVGNSWVNDLTDFTFGTVVGFGMFATQSISVSPGTQVWMPGGSPNIHATSMVFPRSAPTGVTSPTDAFGFETGAEAPPTLTALNVGLPPSSTNDAEPQFDFVTDPTAISKAWVPTSSPLCYGGGICGASMQKAYDDNVTAGKPNFHNDFFVVRLPAGTTLSWHADAGNIQTSMLKGKFFFYVEGDFGGSTPAGWPTTAPNANPLKPDNVIFVYARAPAGKIFAGFNPRFKVGDNTTPVVFTGYVRYDDNATCPTGNTSTINPSAPLTIVGAFHVVGSPCSNFTVNSGTTGTTTRFQFDQNVLNAIGTSFGTNIFVNGKNLGLPPGQFLLMENWIQFRTLGELR